MDASCSKGLWRFLLCFLCLSLSRPRPQAARRSITARLGSEVGYLWPRRVVVVVTAAVVVTPSNFYLIYHIRVH